MPWKHHTLRDAQIWAEVDASGRLVTDEAGRFAVVYKRDPAAKVYRAGARNLGPVEGAPVEELGDKTPVADARSEAHLCCLRALFWQGAGSAGMGLRYQWRRNLSMAVDWAYVLNGAVTTNKHDKRVHASVVIRY